MAKDITEKMESCELLNLTEEKLISVLEAARFHENIPKFGPSTETLVEELMEHMKKQGLSDSALWYLDDYVCNAASAAGSYGYSQGFRDGIILLRTLMKL